MVISEILKAAQERRRQMGLPYEGALLPREAYQPRKISWHERRVVTL